MNTKEECLAFLDKIEEEINNHTWEPQADECDELIPHQDFLTVLADFNIPAPSYVDRDGVYLPEGWLSSHDPETSEDYKQVAEKYFEIYTTLREEVSKELEAFRIEAERDERDAHAEFYRLVGWRK
jgi:hypothetical protein